MKKGNRAHAHATVGLLPYSCMAVISLPAAPPSRRGWLSGGIVKPLAMAPGVVPVLVVPGPAIALPLEDLLAVVLVSDSEGCSLVSPVETSRCKGDEWTGELDFLLPSPPPPRDEFRGDTRPVCVNR